MTTTATANPIADRFRTMADKLQTCIDQALEPRQENTPKRAQQAQQQRNRAARDQRTQQALRALADLHDAGTVPAILTGFKTKGSIEQAMAARMEQTDGTHYDTGEPRDGLTGAERALWELLEPTQVDQTTTELARLSGDVSRNRPPGFFPTPPAVLDLIIDQAEIEPGMLVLEPSAGAGDLVAAAQGEGVTVHPWELNTRLGQILELRGMNPTVSDFLGAPIDPVYDRVVMNPPFEKQADIAHVTHAAQFLKPGGRLVAVMSNGVTFRTDNTTHQFRQWVDQMGGSITELPDGSFRQSGTDVAAVLVVVDQPEQPAGDVPAEQDYQWLEPPVLGDKNDVVLQCPAPGPAAGKNKDLMVRAARLHWPLPDPDLRVIDLTFNRGNFWTPEMRAAYQPVTNDIDPAYHTDHHYDYRQLPQEWTGQFHIVLLDPPYGEGKGTTTGTSFEEMNIAFGLTTMPSKAADVREMNEQGLAEAYRITAPGGQVCLKYADGGHSGKAHPNVFEMYNHAIGLGFEYVDRSIYARPKATYQHARTRRCPATGEDVPSVQHHFAINTSELLIFRRPVRDSAGIPGQMKLDD